MAKRPRQPDFELREADLLGYAPEQLACVQCGGVFCGLRVGRVYQGRPLILCSRKEEAREVLAARRGIRHELA